MFHIRRRLGKAKMPSSSEPPSSPLSKPLSAIAVPGMYLFYKYSEFKRQHQESHRKKVTEKELDHLNHKIDKLLAKIDDKDGDETSDLPKHTPTTDLHTLRDDDECVICMSAKATMQTFPCGHKVICRKCFIKTIQVAVTQRCLPLKCVICRTRILKLRQATTVKIPVTKGQTTITKGQTPATKGQRPRSQSGLGRFSKQSKVYAK